MLQCTKRKALWHLSSKHQRLGSNPSGGSEISHIALLLLPMFQTTIMPSAVTQNECLRMQNGLTNKLCVSWTEYYRVLLMCFTHQDKRTEHVDPGKHQRLGHLMPHFMSFTILEENREGDFLM